MNKLLFLLLISLARFASSQSVVINEAMASNTKTVFDEDGDAPDWIELYNSSSEPVSLRHYYLSDDSVDVKKWRIGEQVMAPHSFLLLFASDKDTQKVYWHTNFKLSASGESLTLSNASGSVLDQVKIPSSLADISFARKSDGAPQWMFQQPSPGSANSGLEVLGYADSISVSPQSGFYPSALSVRLSAADGKIYYTLDGSDPDSASMIYSGLIPITKTTVLKAVAKNANHFDSPIVYQTYFITDTSDLPVVSLITDPHNLFDYKYGIYADGPGWMPTAPHYGANYWMDWERPAHIQFFDDDQKIGFSKNGGIAIYGAYTRSFAQKSFSVKFKNEYDTSTLDYDLFPGFYVKKFNSIILRNSGNDFQYTHIRDAMMQSLIKDLDIDYLEYRPAAAYINGEYWGIYNIREKISEHYIAHRHGIDPDNIDMLEGNMQVIHGDARQYRALVDYISTHDMTTQESYDYVNRMIDLDNCLLYFAAQAYYNSQDWPANNLKYWRERSEQGKWRWILFDLDFGFNLYETTGQSENHVYYIFSGVETRPGSNPPWSTLLPRKLVENPTIRNKFVNLVADLLNTNFAGDRVVARIRDMAAHLAGEGVKHRKRWGISQATFDSHIQRMITFALERPNYLRGFVRDFFKCGTMGKITIAANKGGRVKINTVTLKAANFPWSGQYFMNVPVTITAIAEPGFKFMAWSGAVESHDPSITLPVTRTTNVTATFSPDTLLADAIVINEINYNSSDTFNSGDWIELHNISGHAIPVGGWYFSDSDRNHRFVFPETTAISAHGYLVLVEDSTAFRAQFPDAKNRIGETGFGLDGSGEFMKLVNHEGIIVDSLTYDDRLLWPEEADGHGATLELVDVTSDNSQGQNWRASFAHGTPGRQNSRATAMAKDLTVATLSTFSLIQNYPNPFNPTTVIRYAVPQNCTVSLKIFDLLGREVKTLVNGHQQAGDHSVVLDGGTMAGGMYVYRLEAPGFSQSKKLLLLK